VSLTLSKKLHSLLTSSTRVVVFTGAGISAESGVPTFRAAQGLWKEFPVEKLATPQAFAEDPVRVWQWYCWRRELISKTHPNAGHRAIVRFEGFFDDFHLITQNVDGLHGFAGSRRMLKLHGDIWDVICSSCERSRLELTPVLSPLPPRCQCGGILRPGVVWFGEALPSRVFAAAVEAASKAQLFFSIGTSAEVYPAAQLPQIAKLHGAYVVEINVERSALAHIAHEVLLGKAGEILPELTGCLRDTPQGLALAGA